MSELRQATRQGIKPLIGLYSESGCGKTLSSLLLARGFVGPTGRIGLIDTECGRGSLYADVIPGGYEVLQLEAPFSPLRYIEAMESVEQSGVAVGIVDSGSHEWEGLGGVLDMASEIEEKSAKPGLHIWKAPKMAHNLYMRKMLQSKLPWIICLRAKYKSRQGKNEQGKTVIFRDDHTSPIAAEDFIFECTAHAEILMDHSMVLTKCSHPRLRECFPSKGPITSEHGRLLAAWCAAGAVSPPAGLCSFVPAGAPAAVSSLPKAKLTDELKLAKWIGRCREAGGGHDAYAIEFAVEEGIILDTENISDWPISKLPKTKEEVARILAAIRAKAGVAPVQETIP